MTEPGNMAATAPHCSRPLPFLILSCPKLKNFPHRQATSLLACLHSRNEMSLQGKFLASDGIAALEPLALQPHQEVQVERHLGLHPESTLVRIMVSHHVACVGMEHHFELSVVHCHPADGFCEHLVGEVYSPLAVGMGAIHSEDGVPCAGASVTGVEGTSHEAVIHAVLERKGRWT